MRWDLSSLPSAYLWLIGGVLMSFGFYLAVRGLRWDREAKQRRCPKCWYSMSGIAALQCPECGKTARSEKALHKRRYRWVTGMLGILMVAGGYTVGCWPNVQHGWRGLVPTTALLLAKPSPARALNAPPLPGLNPWQTSSRQPWNNELARRYQAGSLWGWQQRWLIDRDLASTLTMRDVCLDGAPNVLQIAPHWFKGRQHDRELRVWVKTAPETIYTIPIDAFRQAVGFQGRPAAFLNQMGVWRDPAMERHLLPALPAGASSIPFVVELREFNDHSGPEGEVVYYREYDKPIRTTSTPADLLRLDDSASTTRFIRHLRLLVFTDGRTHSCFVSMHPNGPVTLPPDDVTLGLKIEVVHGDETIASVNAVCLSNDAARRARPNDRFLFEGKLTGDVEAVFAADFSEPAWHVRVQGSPAVALQDLEAMSCWVGEFTMPASDVVMRNDRRKSPAPSNRTKPF